MYLKEIETLEHLPIFGSGTASRPRLGYNQWWPKRNGMDNAQIGPGPVSRFGGSTLA